MIFFFVLIGCFDRFNQNKKAETKIPYLSLTTNIIPIKLFFNNRRIQLYLIVGLSDDLGISFPNFKGVL